MNTEDAIASMKEPVDLADLKPGSPLASKIGLMMEEVSHIPKKGHNSVQNYDFATQADTVAACRKAMIKHGVTMTGSLKEKSYTPIVSKQGANGFLVSVTMTFTLTDAESGDCAEFDFPGDGMDYGDKGIYKAMTGAKKYALLDLFNLPTGDDPEKDSAHDKDEPGTGKTFQEKFPAAQPVQAPIVPPEGSQAPSERVSWVVPDDISWAKRLAGKYPSQLKDNELKVFVEHYQTLVTKYPGSKTVPEWKEIVMDLEAEIADRLKGDMVLR